MKHSASMVECMDELSLVSKGGFKSKHDDFLDTIAMLTALTVWKPSQELNIDIDDSGVWDDDEIEEVSGIDSYIV